MGIMDEYTTQKERKQIKREFSESNRTDPWPPTLDKPKIPHIVYDTTLRRFIEDESDNEGPIGRKHSSKLPNQTKLSDKRQTSSVYHTFFRKSQKNNVSCKCT